MGSRIHRDLYQKNSKEAAINDSPQLVTRTMLRGRHIDRFSPSRKLYLNQFSQVFQQGDLPAIEPAGSGINETQRANSCPVRESERTTGIEPNARLTGYQRVVGETRVEEGIRNNQHLII